MLEGAGHLPFLLALLDGRPLVMFFLALGQSQFHLGPALLEIQRRGYQAVALLGQFSGQPLDFTLVQQELAGAGGLMIVVIGKGIGLYLTTHQPDLSIPYARVGLVETGLSQSQRLSAL